MKHYLQDRPLQGFRTKVIRGKTVKVYDWCYHAGMLGCLNQS